MKNKKYFLCQITRHDGTKFHNPLRLSEANLISRIVQENKEVTIWEVEVTETLYNAIFGINKTCKKIL